LAAEAVRRFQQLSAPVAAKGVEDTAFYRYGRLLSRNDVGFDAERFAMSVAEFHTRMAARSRGWPRALLATATHDHKRGEDVRARLAVLSELPGLWLEHVARWRGMADHDGVDPADAYMLYQTLYGAWPDDLGGFGARVHAWQEKALREAKLRSSWEAPQQDYEVRCKALTDALLASETFRADMAELLAATRNAAQANSLAQLALRLTVPGVPDTYQGTELPDLSLVDPDNRRPVDYAVRAHLLDTGGAPKLALLSDLLALRRAHPDLFAHGDYRPLRVTGAHADHVLAFTRTHGDTRLLVAVALRTARIGDWADTCIEGGLTAADLFRDRSVATRLR
jgi:(1->4)-alpha-D-glucan 1-alpha-D-glucosylmutase